MYYRHIGGRNRFDQRSFYGQRISVDDLNYERPRICPALPQGAPHLVGRVGFGPCHRLPHPPLPSGQPMSGLQEEAGVAAASLSISVVADSICAILTAEAATPDLVAINAAIYRAAGFPPGEGAELDLVDCGFPRGNA